MPKLASRVIPLKDYNPTRRFPVITVLLIAANVFVYFLVQRPSDPRQSQVRFNYGSRPSRARWSRAAR